jgi:hypothetical protein
LKKLIDATIKPVLIIGGLGTAATHRDSTRLDSGPRGQLRERPPIDVDPLLHVLRYCMMVFGGYRCIIY